MGLGLLLACNVEHHADRYFRVAGSVVYGIETLADPARWPWSNINCALRLRCAPVLSAISKGRLEQEPQSRSYAWWRFRPGIHAQD